MFVVFFYFCLYLWRLFSVYICGVFCHCEHSEAICGSLRHFQCLAMTKIFKHIRIQV